MMARIICKERAEGVLLHQLEISQESGTSGRRLGPGAIVIGGGLQADLLIPTLIDQELCEVILPSTPDKPLKVTALVEGLVVNGREIRLGQSVTAPRLELSADGVTLRIAGATDEAEALGAAPSSRQEMLTALMDRVKKGAVGRAVPGHGGERGARPDPPEGSAMMDRLSDAGGRMIPVLNANPAYSLSALALVLGLSAFAISGWPSARFNAPKLTSVAEAGKDTPAAMLAEIRRRLVAADLASAIKAEISGGAIRLSGVVDPVQAQRYGNLVSSMTRSGDPPIRNEVTMANADAATGIESVITAPTKGVVVSGGRLFREGQTIPSGWIVERIGKDEVTLRRDTISHVIAMSGPTPEPPPTPSRAALEPTARGVARGVTRGLETVSSPPPEAPRQSGQRGREGVTLIMEQVPKGQPALQGQPR